MSELVGDGERQRGKAECFGELGRQGGEERGVMVSAGAVDPDRVSERGLGEEETVALVASLVSHLED